MSVTLLKCLLPLACAVHLALLYCDRIITLLDGGRFDFRLLNNKKLSAVMGTTPTERPMRSMVLGAFAMTAAMPAYLALGAWVLPQSPVCGALMLADGILFLLLGVAHHVLCGAVEWFYLRMNKTGEARAAIVEFFKKTSVTMYVCYFGLLTFTVSFFIAVVTGTTVLPRWVCVFNTLPLFLLLLPFHIVCTGNIANAIMFAGLFFLKR